MDLVGDEDGVGDGFDGEDGIGGDGTADRGGEVGGVVVAVGAGLGEAADEGQAFGVGVGKGGPAVLVSCNGLGKGGVGGEVRMQLLEHGSAIGFPSRFGGDVEDGHLLLQGVDIDMEDPCSFFRPALGRYPRDVAVCHENHVCRRYAIIDAVPQTQTCPMVRREAHIAPSGIKHPQTLDRIRKLHQLSYSRMIPPSRPNHNQRLLRPRQSLRNHLHRFNRQCARLYRLPLLIVQCVGLQLFLHHLPRPIQIDRPARRRRSKLQRTPHHLLDIPSRFELPCIPAVLGNDLLLIGDILDPVDVFGS